MIRLGSLSSSGLVLCFAFVNLGFSHQTSKTSRSPLKEPTVEEAKAFVEKAEAKLLALSVDASRANWVQATYITEDTEILSARANERAIAAGVDFAKRATRFD